MHISNLDTPFVTLWCGLIVWAIFITIALHRPVTRSTKQHRIAYWLSVSALIVPILVLAVMFLLFRIGGAHPTAQLNPPDDLRLWSLWLDLGRLLLLATLLAPVLILASCFFYWKPATSKRFAIMRVSVLFADFLAFYAISENVPTA